MRKTSPPSKELIVLDGDSPIGDLSHVCQDLGRVVLVPFTAEERLVERVRGVVESEGGSVEILRVEGRLDAVAVDTRRRYTELVGAIKDSEVNGRSLTDAFVFDDGLSLWWLHDSSSKRSDLFETFTRLAQLDLLWEIVAETEPTGVTLLTADDEFGHVVSELSSRLGIRFRCPGMPARTGRSGGSGRWFSFRVMVNSIKYLFRAFLETLIAKVVGPRLPGEQVGCAFYSKYPKMWKRDGERYDEKYVRVPGMVQRRSGEPTCYAVSMSSGISENLSLRSYARCCSRLKAMGTDASGVPIHLIDAELSVGDFVDVLRALPMIWRFARLEDSSEFRGAWRYREVDVFPIVREEFRRGTVRLCRMLLHARRFRGYVGGRRVRTLVVYLFEFPEVRAGIQAIRRRSPSTRIVGAQHGPIARLKLPYSFTPKELGSFSPTSRRGMPNAPDTVPMPDIVLVEGMGASKCLREAGFPSDRIHVGGAPRLAGLMNDGVWPRRPEPSGTEDERESRISVAFGQHDAAVLLASCVPVMQRRPEWRFVFNLHPRGSVSGEEIAERLRRAGVEGSAEIAVGRTYENVFSSSALVATYSSVGMEAACLGIPVVVVHAPDRINQSPLFDEELRSVIPFARGAMQLERILDRMVRGEGSVRASEIVEEHCFLMLDGLSESRWAAFLS